MGRGEEGVAVKAEARGTQGPKRGMRGRRNGKGGGKERATMKEGIGGGGGKGRKRGNRQVWPDLGNTAAGR